MPITKTYRGDSVAFAKILNVTPVGPIAAGQTFTAWCNGKPAPYTAITGDTIASVSAGLAAAIALAAGSIPEFTEMVASVNGNTLVLTAATPGVPFEMIFTGSGNMSVAETTLGIGPTNEVHQISLLGTYTAGTFTATYNFGSGNVTTSAIAYNASAATLQTALAALSGVGAGNVLVTGGPGPATPWFVSWVGTFAGTAVTPGTIDGSSLTGSGTVNISTQQPGAPLTDCIQQIQLQATSGSFTLTFLGQTTGSISLGSSAATIQTALQGLSSIGSGNALVYGEGASGISNANLFFVHFTSGLAGLSLPVITMNGSGLSGSGSTNIVQQGAATSQAAYQFVDLTSSPAPANTTFTLTFNGQTTGAISTMPGAPGYVSIAVKSALQAIGCPVLSVIGSDALTGVASTTFCVKISSYTPQAAPVLTATIASFSPTITVLTTGIASQNDIQRVWVAAAGGTFTLTLGAQTTSAIAYNAVAGTIQTRIQTDLSATITACTVTGAGTSGNPWIITVTNPANTVVAQMTGNSSGLTGSGQIIEVTHGQSGTNEVQTITTAAGVSGGTFTLAFLGSPTAPIAWNATAAQVQAALLTLSTINTVTVTGSTAGPWTVTFSGTEGSAPQPLIVPDGSLLTGMLASPITVSTITWSAGPLHYDDPNNWLPYGVPGATDLVFYEQGSSPCLYGFNQIATFIVNSSIQTIVVSASGGTFTLTESAQTTAAIAYNASAAALQSAILAAFTNTVTACTVTGAGTSASPWVVTMLGVNGLAQPFMTANAGSLTGGASTVTINATTFVWTGKSSMQTGQAVLCSSVTTLPATLGATTLYYLINVNRDAQTFQLATTAGGTPVAVTTLGTGTHTVGARLGYFEHDMRFTGPIGLPKTNSLGYVEYRQRSLHIGLASLANGGTKTVILGSGSGSGSPKIQLDTDIDETILKVMATGGSTDQGIAAVTWKGQNPSNTANLIGGDLGIALFAGETALLAALTQRSGTLELGAGATLTGPFEKTGGQITLHSATVNGTCLVQ